MTLSRPNRAGPELRTYSHLAAARRVPDEYDLGTTDLLYYPRRGFSLELPVVGWYERYQRATPLVSQSWDTFADPRRTTYAAYTSIAHERESHAEGIFDAIQATKYDARLAPDWVAVLDRVIGPLRYPLHGLQMIAAYVASMAPAGRAAVALAFQAADEMRRVQQLSRRMIQLRETHPDFGESAKRTWQEDPAWQPLREVVERLLVTYDFGEALVALTLCVKPVVDEVFGPLLGAEGSRRGDPLLAALLNGFSRDIAWHRAVTAALLAVPLHERGENRAVVERWLEVWAPRAAAAAAPFSFFLQTGSTDDLRAISERTAGWARDLVRKEARS